MFQPIGSINRHKTIHIVGAGFSGLILGYFLKKQNIDFIIYERENYPGGKIGTIDGQLGKAETGAHAFYANREIKEEFECLGLKPLSAQKNLSKKILHRNKIEKISFGLLDILKIIIRFFFKAPPVVTEKTSLDDFLRPLLGTSLSDKLLPAAFIGIYALGPKEINFQALYPDMPPPKSYLEFFKKRRKIKSKEYESVSFQGGMRSLIDALKIEMQEHIRLQANITELPANSILCTDAHEASELLSPSDGEKAKALERIEYTKVTGATVLTKAKIKDLEQSFGALNSYLNSKILGVLNNYAIFKEQQINQDYNSYTFIMNGDSDIQSTLHQALRGHELDYILNQEHEIIYHPWTRGIPKYNQSQFQAINILKKHRWNELALFGNYIGGISLREIFYAAKNFSQGLK